MEQGAPSFPPYIFLLRVSRRPFFNARSHASLSSGGAKAWARRCDTFLARFIPQTRRRTRALSLFRVRPRVPDSSRPRRKRCRRVVAPSPPLPSVARVDESRARLGARRLLGAYFVVVVARQICTRVSLRGICAMLFIPRRSASGAPRSPLRLPCSQSRNSNAACPSSL